MEARRKRREFLQRCPRTILLAPPAGLWLAGCGGARKIQASRAGEKEPAIKSNACEDLGVS